MTTSAPALDFEQLRYDARRNLARATGDPFKEPDSLDVQLLYALASVALIGHTANRNMIPGHLRQEGTEMATSWVYRLRDNPTAETAEAAAEAAADFLERAGLIGG